MRLADVLHQERAISILRRALRSGRAHHAYLFSGPEGVGKELAARALAQRLLCDGDLAPDADACSTCAACKLVESASHPDLHIIDRGLRKFHPERRIRASKGLFLGVDLIRHFLIDAASSTPAHGRARVFVVREAERMNEEAQNALLKTLEEPPGRARLVLITSSAMRLLPTIRSRCQLIPFDALPTPFVQQRIANAAKIAGAALAPDEAATLARLSGGRIGAALSWQRRGLLTALGSVCDALVSGAFDDPEGFSRLLIDAAGKLDEQASQADAAASGDENADDAESTDDGDETDDDASDTAAPAGRSKTANTDELREGLKLVFMLIASACRDALVLSSGSATVADSTSDALLLPISRRASIELARRDSPERLDRAIHATAEAETMLDRNVAPALTCERLAAVLAGALP